jgi:hypothetical protein
VKTFSDPTIALLVQLGITKTRTEIDLLLMRSDLVQFEPERPPGTMPNKTDLLLGYLRQANTAAAAGDQVAHKGLLDFARRLPSEVNQFLDNVKKLLADLSDALLADGYKLTMEPLGGAVLLPTEPSAAPLPPEITALEAELNGRGYDVALNHYRQAVSNLLEHRYEAANASIRTALEELVTRLAIDYTGYVPRLDSNGKPTANQGGLAITHLVETTKTIPADDGGMMLRGLWKMSCTNGPHPGRSNADEARSRLQLVTATARILLGYFPV